MENVDNYRGVSLLSIVSKCYTVILNARLYSWLEENKVITESQAGFRKHYSTLDQIFNILCICSKKLKEERSEIVCCFC